MEMGDTSTSLRPPQLASPSNPLSWTLTLWQQVVVHVSSSETVSSLLGLNPLALTLVLRVIAKEAQLLSLMLTWSLVVFYPSSFPRSLVRMRTKDLMLRLAGRYFKSWLIR
jgi:hypothetical protein